jgi:hypothetical protein
MLLCERLMDASRWRRIGFSRFAALLLLLSGCDAPARGPAAAVPGSDAADRGPAAAVPNHDAAARVREDPVPGHLRSGSLVDKLRSRSEAEKRVALRELRHVGWYYPPDSPLRSEEQVQLAVDTLRAMLRDGVEPLRLEALEVLLALSMRANNGSQSVSVKDALPELVAIASATGQDEQLRAHAVDAMRWLGPATVQPLAQLVFDRRASLQLRVLAVRALRDKGEEAERELRRAVETPELPAPIREASLETMCRDRGAACAHAVVAGR